LSNLHTNLHTELEGTGKPMLTTNSLPLCMNQKRRGMDVDTRCPLCLRIDEDGGQEWSSLRINLEKVTSLVRLLRRQLQLWLWRRLRILRQRLRARWSRRPWVKRSNFKKTCTS
jgi:hypothetical protein